MSEGLGSGRPALQVVGTVIAGREASLACPADREKSRGDLSGQVGGWRRPGWEDAGTESSGALGEEAGGKGTQII